MFNPIDSTPSGQITLTGFQAIRQKVKLLIYSIVRKDLVISGSYSTAAVVQTVFTVTVSSQPSSTYRVVVTPSNVLSSAPYHVTNKTATTFDVTYAAGLTGTVAFDWLILN